MLKLEAAALSSKNKKDDGADPRTLEEKQNKVEFIDFQTMFVKEKKRAISEIAKYISEKYNIITVGEKEREVYIYRNGYYQRGEYEIVYPLMRELLGDKLTKHDATEIMFTIHTTTAHPRSVFNIPSLPAVLPLIPLVNGLYDYQNKQLIPHDHAYFFTYQFPITFQADADCPKIKKFISEVLSDDQAHILEEWLGYYFLRRYAYKKAIVFVGEGDTGKTTLMEVISFLLGRENIAGVSLQKMASDKFGGAQLYGKHANLVDELSASDIVDTGKFKMATGDSTVTAEYKYGNQFSFTNFAKMTFACNKIPDVKDFDDEAYFNRWMVIAFDKVITTKIPNFIDTLRTEEERSGLFNLAMNGLQRLISQGHFSYIKTAMETKMEMMRSGSSIAQFVSRAISQEQGAEISKERLHEAYSAFCVQNNLAIETIKMFGSKFLFYAGYATEGLIYDEYSPKGKRVRGWRNVAILKSEEDIKIDETF